MRVGLSDFVEDPQAHPLKTPSGLVEIYSEEYVRTGASPTPECRILAADERYPLRLITPKSRFRIHSQNDNIPWFKERERQALWINPINAAERGVENGREVLVNRPEGRVRIEALVTEDMMLGVVCLLEGVWPRFDSEGVETAGSVNVLTSTTPTEPSKGSRTHSVLVEVTRARKI
jgi:anaerobic dimethyl sulfoxide reductase subunit A